MTKDNVIVFPTDRIVNNKKILTDTKEVQKQYEKIHKEQTREFVEGVVDDTAVQLLRIFIACDIRVTTPQFTRDLALLIDILRGLIYRDFNVDYPSQKLVEEMVSLYHDKELGPSAKVDYERVLKNVKNVKTDNVFSNEISQDLDELNEDIIFEPDFDPDK